MSDKKSTKLITPKATISYPHLVTPQPGQNGGKAKFSVSLVFAPGTDLSKLKEAVINAIEAKWPGKSAALMANSQFRKPFRDDAEDKGYAPGSIFINARSEQKPGVVFAYAGTDGKPVVMTDEQIAKEMYPGSQARASVTFFAYDTAGNKGVGVAINNLQKLGEGDRLDNRVAAENEFEADLSAKPADLDALLQ